MTGSVRLAAALLAGIAFGFGLALGGMLDPAVIRGFLDVFGDFDPRLGFVFAGALLVSGAGYALSRRLAKPLVAPRFAVPAGRPVDRRLVFGAALFGAGWGMVGLCPGPAIAGLTLGIPEIFVFTVAMAAGMAAYEVSDRRDAAPSPADAPN